RRGEIQLLGPLFLDTLERCRQQLPELHCVLPAANAARRAQLDALLAARPRLQVQVLDGQSHLAMAAADAVLLASGTSALEAMLLKQPMLVAYRAGRITPSIGSRMLRVAHVPLPNRLAGRERVPELLQDRARGESLTEAVLGALADAVARGQLV